jgi:hypothetical protein
MARLVAIAVVAVVAALCAAPASAFNIDFDPDTIPRIPCGSPGATRDVWCGTWLTDQPTGPMWTFGPMGVLELQRISEADARAREGTQFGDFNYTVRCFDGALFYAGTYNGPAGRVMACTNGSVLKGFYRSQSLENTGPGSGLRSGEFEITHSLGGEGASDFTGTITQHFAGTTNWKGHCASSSCTATGTGAPVVPPGAPAGQPPIIGPPLFRIVNISSSPTHRSGVDGVVRTPKIGWLIGAKDRLTATGSVRINGAASIELEALPSGAVFEIRGSAVQDSEGNPIATPAVFEAAGVPVLRQGEATVTASGPRTQARTTAIAGAVLLTPVARVDVSGGVAHVAHNPRSRVTTVGNERGSVSVAPTNPALRSRRLVPGKQVQVTGKAIGRPFDLVPNLQTTIPSPREIRAGPAIVTASWRLSLRSLKRSRCVAVAVSSARPARVLVTIFSGRRSVRLFGQRLVVFTAAARKSTCIKVPAHARTFNVRTPLRLAVGYALGARPRRGERATQPVIKPIQLVP